MRPDQAYALKHAYGMFEPGRQGAALLARLRAPASRHADPLRRFRDAYRRVRSPDPLDRAMYVDVHTYMVDDILTKVDRMSMAVSLEAREPLLDHKLLEFAARVPTSLKLRNGPSKYLLRRVLDRRVPAIDPRARQARLRRADRRVAARTAGADGGRTARSMAGCAIAASSTTARFARSGPSTARGRADHRHRLWQLVMLELWFRQFVDRARRAGRGRAIATRRRIIAMCGIAGIVAADRLTPTTRSR